jgi:hypothetical protein
LTEPPPPRLHAASSTNKPSNIKYFDDSTLLKKQTDIIKDDTSYGLTPLCRKNINQDDALIYFFSK